MGNILPVALTSLTHDQTKNTVTLTMSNGAVKEIPLPSGNGIDKISQSADNKTLTIRTTDGKENTLQLPQGEGITDIFSDNFNMYIITTSGKSIPIKLPKGEKGDKGPAGDGIQSIVASTDGTTITITTTAGVKTAIKLPPGTHSDTINEIIPDGKGNINIKTQYGKSFNVALPVGIVRIEQSEDMRSVTVTMSDGTNTSVLLPQSIAGPPGLDGDGIKNIVPDASGNNLLITTTRNNKFSVPLPTVGISGIKQVGENVVFTTSTSAIPGSYSIPVGRPANIGTSLRMDDFMNCLDISNGTMSNGTTIQNYQCNDGIAQQWIYRASDMSIRSANDTSYCLTMPRTTVSTNYNDNLLKLNKCDTANVMKQWKYNANDKTIRPNGNEKYCIDLANNSRVNGNSVGVWECNGGTNQKFYMY